MKKFYLLLAVAAVLGACQSSSKKEAAEKDRLFKDSIARADGEKVLGNMRFGADHYTFYTDKLQFLKDQEKSLYGNSLGKIEGEYTPEKQVYEVRIFSSDCDDHKWDEVPFRDFMLTKYGLETEPNVWVVGDRVFSIVRETFSQRTKEMVMRWAPETDPETAFREFWYLKIESKKWIAENERQMRERGKASEEEARQREAQEQKKKENDLKTL